MAGLRVRPRKTGSAKDGVSRRTSSYRGVSYHRPSAKWRARIKVGSQEVRLGYFSTETEAAAAYDQAAMVYHGTPPGTVFFQSGLSPLFELGVALEGDSPLRGRTTLPMQAARRGSTFRLRAASSLRPPPSPLRRSGARQVAHACSLPSKVPAAPDKPRLPPARSPFPAAAGGGCWCLKLPSLSAAACARRRSPPLRGRPQDAPSLRLRGRL